MIELTGNLTIIVMQNLFNKMKTMIENADIKARLYDTDMNLVKEFIDIFNIYVNVEGDYVYLYLRFIDDSEAEYRFRWMYVLGKDGETVFHVIIHPFQEEYEKKKNQIVDIKLRTGITGCVSG